MLIDNKFEMDHDGIITKLREFTDKPILYVINTHMHGDHSGGNAKNQALGAKVIAHENARFQMAMTQTAGLPTITLEEVERQLHAAKLWKAPGDDGLPVIVWKQVWLVVKD